jgi:hypothetical protein
MSTVQEIEAAISQLSPEELAAFRQWFARFDNEPWDRQVEQDAAAGRLDALADEEVRDMRLADKSSELLT